MNNCSTCGRTEKYNGYANYETWSVALLIDNDQGLKEEVVDFVTKYQSETEGMTVQSAKGDLAKWLKEAIYDWLEVDNLNPFQAQMINSALGGVDWHELAQHYIDEATE